MYRILLSYSALVQPLSCDEAYLDVTGLGDPEALAAAIRADIERETRCTASAGVGPSMLVARIATKHAKPNGVKRIAAQVCPHPRPSSHVLDVFSYRVSGSISEELPSCILLIRSVTSLPAQILAP